MAVDTVISTVTGAPELELLKAAVAQGVRRFAPAEFEGRPTMRPTPDPLDRGKRSILQWLDHYRSQNQIECTVFVCGILYERFGPGGLSAHGLGLQTDLCNEGDYIVNVRTMEAVAPVYDSKHQLNISICLTAAQDAAHLIVRAIDSSHWPREMTMAGERMSVYDLTAVVSRVRGIQVLPPSRRMNLLTIIAGVPLTTVIWHDPLSLQDELALAQESRDIPRQMRAHDHIATCNERYDFPFPGNLRASARGRDVQPIPFETWLRTVWANVPVTPSKA
jgi:hypothetical protein